MYWPVVVFEVACWVTFTALAVYYTSVSVRARSMHIGLWMVIGVAAMSWMEAPFDNSMYAVFHPDFARLPKWGPIGATQGQLPQIAPPGYILYFIVPALIGVAAGKAVMRKYGWRQGNALLACGFATGILWDAFFEIGETHTAHLWAYARVAPGLTISPGGISQVPVYVFLAMAAFIMPLTYVLGAVDRDGQPMLMALVARRTSPGAARTVAMLIVSVMFTNVTYALTYLPHVITKSAHLLTQSGKLVPFPGKIAIQPGADATQHDGALGSLIIWGWLLAMTALVFKLVAVIDARMLAAQASTATERVAPDFVAEIQA